MQFTRDLRVPDGYSKYNLLATMCASVDHRSRWYHPESKDLVAVQCGEGRIIGPDGVENRPHAVILHDWDEKYTKALERAVKVVSFGKKEGAPGNAVVLESFPLPPLRQQPVGKDSEILIAGQCMKQEDLEFALETVKGMDRGLSVTVALDERGSAGMDREILKLVHSDELAGFDRVKRVKSPSYHMMVALYESSGIIIHCGSGSRGFLHALAVKMGHGVFTRHNDNSFEPETMERFVEEFQEWSK